MGDSLVQINEYLEVLFSYGAVWVYAVLFAACFIENIFPPFPGDTFIAAAGGLVALGRLDAVLTFVVVNVGGMASVMLLYWLGRRYGRDYFVRKDFKYFSAKDIDDMETRLARWGAWILIGSRFMVGMRAILAIAAGLGRYPAGRMVTFSTVSYFAFTGLILYIAATTVANIDYIVELFARYNQIVWPVLVLVAVLLVVRRIMSRSKYGKAK